MEQLSQLSVTTIQVDKALVFSGDKRRISVVLNNLITNAIKYSDTSKVNPFIKITVQKSKQGVEVKVMDNGEGIDETQLQKIFHMFYRVSNKSTGSGIGLYIVKEVIQKITEPFILNPRDLKQLLLPFTCLT